MKREFKFLERNLLKNGDTYDKPLLWVLLCLIAFGLVMIYSATAATEVFNGHYDERYNMVIKQAKYAAIGIAVGLGVVRIKMYTWLRWSKIFVAVSIIGLMILVGVGQKVNGAVRWLDLGFINIQVSEVFKLTAVLYVAGFFQRYKSNSIQLNYLSRMAIPIIVGGGIIALGSSDLGSTLVIFGIIFGLLVLINLSWKQLSVITFLLLTLASVIIGAKSYRLARISNAWMPWEDPFGIGYQSMGALMSSHNGSWFGQGLANAVIKRGFLPESHNDFIFAVITEEFGWLRVLLLIGVYLWLTLRAFSIGKQARDLELYFSSFVAYGIAIWVSVQTLIHITVNFSLFPNKGLTLPLISYGGSSLIMMMVAFSMLLRVDYENRQKLRGFDVGYNSETGTQS